MKSYELQVEFQISFLKVDVKFTNGVFCIRLTFQPSGSLESRVCAALRFAVCQVHVFMR